MAIVIQSLMTQAASQIAAQTLQSEPLTAAANAGQAVVAHGGDSMSIISLMAEASLTVQLVMFMLFLASLYSWSIIFSKTKSLHTERKLTAEFEKEFWSGGSMQSLFDKWGAETKKSSGMSEIFVAGYSEYQRLSERGYANNSDLLDAVQRAMRVELGREIDHLEAQIPFLATVGSTSPYVGLFGTVWGIMNSFISLGSSTQQATIASVAPGIAEALIATAMGLFAAIPAVIAYNRFSYHVERLVGQYEVFMEEFVSIVNRQLTIEDR
jgi:biopolymer transport protein TolQ